MDTEILMAAIEAACKAVPELRKAHSAAAGQGTDRLIDYLAASHESDPMARRNFGLLCDLIGTERAEVARVAAQNRAYQLGRI